MKKVTALHQAPVPRRQGEPVAARRSGARPARREHHAVLQGVQRAHRAAGRPDHPGADHGVRRPLVHVHHQDAARRRSCSRRRRRSTRARASRTRTRSARSRKKQVREIAELKLPDLNTTEHRGGDALRRRHRALDGPRSRRLNGPERSTDHSLGARLARAFDQAGVTQMAGKKYKKALERLDPIEEVHGRRGVRAPPRDQDLGEVRRDRRRRRSASASTRSTPTRWSAARS